MAAGRNHSSDSAVYFEIATTINHQERFVLNRVHVERGLEARVEVQNLHAVDIVTDDVFPAPEFLNSH